MELVVNNTVDLKFALSNFTPQTLAKGNAYLQQGRVLSYQLEPHDGGGIAGFFNVTATVQGQVHHPYQVAIFFSNRSNFFEAVCSCSIGSNCKHCAAALLKVQQPYIPQKTDKKQSNPLEKPLNSHLDSWLTELTRQDKSEDDNEEERLVYWLEVNNKHHDPVVVIQTGLSRPLKRGGLSKPRHFNIDSTKSACKLQPKDFGLISQLNALPENNRYWKEKNRYEMRGKPATALLYEMIETDRCYWNEVGKQRLQLGKSKDAELKWQMMRDGTQYATFVSPTHPGLIFLPLDPVHYIDPVQSTVGVINTELPEHMAYQFMKMPPVPPMEVLNFKQKMEQQLKAIPSLPLPQVFDGFEEHIVTPTPQLAIYSTLCGMGKHPRL